MKIKKLLASISFLCLTILLLSGVSWLLRDRTTTLSAMYSEPDDTLDVIIVGSSHVNNGYIPNLLWEENHASACNVYSWSQPMWVSYHYIKETLKTQDPSVIVLELFGMTYGHSHILPDEIDRTSYANSFNIDPGINRLQLIATSERCGIDLRESSDFLNLVRYHTRWKYLNRDMFTYDPHDQYDYLKGYGFVLTTQSAEAPSIPIPEEPFEPYEYCVEYLDKIVALCQKENIDLIFTLTPYVYNEAEAGIYRWLELYAQEHDIPFLNYNGEDGKRIGFDYATDMTGIGHCNYYGAQKLTKDLCDYLKQHYEFPAAEQHSNYAVLNDSLSKYYRLMPLNEIMSCHDLSSWLQAALSDDETCVFLYDTLNHPGITSDLHETLQQLGFPVPTRTAVLRSENSLIDPQTFDLSAVGSSGIVTFSEHDGFIQLNGTAVPAPSDAQLVLVLYDTTLQRPVQCAWITAEQPETLSGREFTSDILHLYQ